MPTQTAAELLIRIAADPSSAEASIERFRVHYARDLTVVDNTTRQLADRFRVSLNLVDSLLNRTRQMAGLWKTELVTSFADVLNSSEALANSLGRSFLIFD